VPFSQPEGGKSTLCQETQGERKSPPKKKQKKESVEESGKRLSSFNIPKGKSLKDEKGKKKRGGKPTHEKKKETFLRKWRKHEYRPTNRSRKSVLNTEGNSFVSLERKNR